MERAIVVWSADRPGRAEYKHRHRLRSIHKLKFRRKNSSNGVINPIQRDRFTESIPRLPPNRFLHKRLLRITTGAPFVPVFLRRELAAQGQPHAQHVEESRGNLLAVQVFRCPGIGQIKTLKPDARHLLEGAGTALPIEKIGIGDRQLAFQRHECTPAPQPADPAG